MGGRYEGGNTHRAHHLAQGNRFALRHGNVSQQAVLGHIAVSVVNLHLVAQALAGTRYHGYAPGGGRIHPGPLRGNQVQTLMQHLQVVHGIVLHAHRGSHLHVGHVFDGKGEGRDAVGPFLQHLENIVEIPVYPGGHGHEAVGMLGGRYHIMLFRKVFIFPHGQGSISANLVQGRRPGLEEFLIDGLVLVQQALDDIPDQAFLGLHGVIQVAVQAVFLLQPFFLLGREKEREQHIDHDGRRHGGNQVPQPGHHHELGLAFFLLCSHQSCGFLTSSA